MRLVQQISSLHLTATRTVHRSGPVEEFDMLYTGLYHKYIHRHKLYVCRVSWFMYMYAYIYTSFDIDDDIWAHHHLSLIMSIFDSINCPQQSSVMVVDPKKNRVQTKSYDAPQQSPGVVSQILLRSLKKKCNCWPSDAQFLRKIV